MRNTLEILIDARDILSEPANWTKGESARDYSGKSTNPYGNFAVCWCAEGALEKASRSKTNWVTRLSAMDILGDLVREMNLGYDIQSLHKYNDLPETSHEDILNLFDQAIELERKSPRPLLKE